jgi:hypothetical protein
MCATEILIAACLCNSLLNAFLSRFDAVVTDPSVGVPDAASWLVEFFMKKDFLKNTEVLLKEVVTQTANAWMEEIGSQRVAVGYTSTVDLDTAMSTRAAKASAFLKRFRGTIRANTIAKLLVNYSGDCEWNLPQRVNFNHFVVEPVVSECVYNAHCGLLHIPATFEDVLYRLSEEDRLKLYDAWKETRKSSIGVLNCMLKAYYLVGYCVFRRLQTVCNSHRSHKLASCAHEVSGKFILYYTILYCTLPYHTIPCYTILYYTIPYYTLLYHIIPCHTILYYTIVYRTIPYYTMPYHTLL